jgi:hypothetical protein
MSNLTRMRQPTGADLAGCRRHARLEILSAGRAAGDGSTERTDVRDVWGNNQ